MKLLVNSIQCIRCRDVLVSRHRHDYQECSCQSVSCDGGLDYRKRSGAAWNYEERSIMSDDIRDYSKHLFWGVNYTKEMVKLPEIIFKPINELNSEHLQAIIRTQKHMSKDYKLAMLYELAYREDINE